MEEHYLIEGIKSRNKIIFDFVFHYYYSGLCAFAERFTNNENTAEDIVQDLFVTLWLKHDSIQINTSLKNYLFTAVKNRSLDHLKKEKNKEKGMQYISYTTEPSMNHSIYWFAESELKELIDKLLGNPVEFITKDDKTYKGQLVSTYGSNILLKEKEIKNRKQGSAIFNFFRNLCICIRLYV